MESRQENSSFPSQPHSPPLMPKHRDREKGGERERVRERKREGVTELSCIQVFTISTSKD